MFLQPDFEGNPDPFPFPMIPPSVAPDEGDLVRIEINREWLTFVTGAATTLCLAKAWITDNDADALEIQAKAQDLLGVLNTPIEEPPFYEDDNSAGSEQLPDQPWYDTLSDWIITAFLALTFTPGTGIVYKETIPRLRVALRTGNLGAVVRVLIDDLEIWTGSTFSETIGLLEQELDVAQFAIDHSLGSGPHVLRIEHGGPPGGVDYADPSFPKGKLEVELGDIRPREEAMYLRQSGCLIETSTDNATWTTLYDPTACVDGLIAQGIQDAIQDGTLQGGTGQQGPEPAPTDGNCTTYHGRLQPGLLWHCPSPVQAGDTIRIRNAAGGWSLGELAWYCPDGSRYLLGSCSDELKTHVDGDWLNPGAAHMQLIGRIGDIFFDAMTGEYTVPTYIPASDLFLVANSNALGPGSGEVTFDVEVCRHDVPMTYIHHFFAGHDGIDWFTYPYPGQGAYNAENDWVDATLSGNYNAFIRLATAGKHITRIRAIATCHPGGISGLYLNFHNGPDAHQYPVNYACDVTVNGDGDTTDYCDFGLMDYVAGNIHITEVIVSGNGPDPFV